MTARIRVRRTMEGWGTAARRSPNRTMTRYYTDAENTGVPVVPILSDRNDADVGRQDLDEQVFSHRRQRA